MTDDGAVGVLPLGPWAIEPKFIRFDDQEPGFGFGNKQSTLAGFEVFHVTAGCRDWRAGFAVHEAATPAQDQPELGLLPFAAVPHPRFDLDTVELGGPGAAGVMGRARAETRAIPGVGR